MNKLAYTFVAVALLGLCGCPTPTDPLLAGTWSMEEMGLTTSYTFADGTATKEEGFSVDVPGVAAFSYTATSTGTYTTDANQVVIRFSAVDVTVNTDGLSEEVQTLLLAALPISTWTEWEEAEELLRTANLLLEGPETSPYVVDGDTLTLGTVAYTRQP